MLASESQPADTYIVVGNRPSSRLRTYTGRIMYCFGYLAGTRDVLFLLPLPTHQTFVDLLSQQVSTANTLGESGGLSPLQADMAEQGHKARASAARLEEVDVTGNDGGEVAGGMINGMMPLRCSVHGRCGRLRVRNNRRQPIFRQSYR